jgi:hypothetical protein
MYAEVSLISRIRQEIQGKMIQARISRQRITQEFKSRRILPGKAFLASPDKIVSTWILSESSDLFFQARIWKDRWEDR